MQHQRLDEEDEHPPQQQPPQQSQPPQQQEPQDGWMPVGYKYSDYVVGSGEAATLPVGDTCDCTTGNVDFKDMFYESIRIFKIRPWDSIGVLFLLLLIQVIGMLIIGAMLGRRKNLRALGLVLGELVMIVCLPIVAGYMVFAMDMMRGGQVAARRMVLTCSDAMFSASLTKHLVGAYLLTRLPTLILDVLQLIIDVASNEDEGARIGVGVTFGILRAIVAVLFMLVLPCAVDRPDLPLQSIVNISVAAVCRNGLAAFIFPFYILGFIILGLLMCIVGVFPAIMCCLISSMIFYGRTIGLKGMPEGPPNEMQAPQV